MTIKYLVKANNPWLMTIALMLSLLAIGCDKNSDEPSNSSKYEIVGTWNSEYNGNTIVTTINQDGTLSYIETWNGKTRSGRGSWSYEWDSNSSNTWHLWFDDSNGRLDAWNGEYMLMNGQLVQVGPFVVIFNRGTGDESGTGNGGNTGNDSDPSIKAEDFYGYWLSEYRGSVYEFQKNSTGTLYYLSSESNGETEYYDSKETISWNYDEKSQILSITKNNGTVTYDIVSMSQNSFSTTTGTWVKRYAGPTDINDKNGTGVLAGTKWSGTVDGDYVELSFNTDGTMTEIYDGEKSTTKYLEAGDQLIFEPGSVIYNTFGEKPVNFTVNSNLTTLKIYNNWETWSFTRKL